MKREVRETLEVAAITRRQLLQALSYDERLHLIESLFGDFFVHQWRVLLKWAALTGQSAQIDTGYIAQHVASLVLTEPGQGFKGKGVDLLDGTEVKSAAILSGVDRPRWNHNMGTIAQDASRRKKNEPTFSEMYLGAPTLFYLLFDRFEEEQSKELVLRVRAWSIDAQKDKAWRNLVKTFVDTRTASRYNLQLHPPVGYDDDMVINTLGGNLDFADVKVLEARIYGAGGTAEFRVEWVQTPPEVARPTTGCTVAYEYKRDPGRSSRLSLAADVAIDWTPIRELLPDWETTKFVELFAAELAAAEPSLFDDSTENRCDCNGDEEDLDAD